jgi:hypothetical protein
MMRKLIINLIIWGAIVLLYLINQIYPVISLSPLMFKVDNISYYNNFISDYIDSYNTIETINDKGMIRAEF